MNKQLTGKIRQNKHVIIFTSDGFTFTFVRVDDYKDTDGNYLHFTLKPDEAGYIWGVTSDQSVIAIYIKENRDIYHSLVTNTWNYIVFNHEPYEKTNGNNDDRFLSDDVPLIHKDSDELSGLFGFTGIEFLNGFVRSVNPCNALHEDFDLEKRFGEYEKTGGESEHEILVYKVYNDNKKFSVNVGDDSSDWQFGSVVSQRNDINKGEALSNDISSLIIEFTSGQTLKKFYDYYGYVSDIMAFLTYRSEVYFESIKLLSKHPQFGLLSIAECYVKYGKSESIRDIVRVISVKSFTDDMFERLVTSSMVKSKECAGLPISIIPKDDDDAILMTTDKIRNICSALEAEINATGVKCVKNTELENLVEKVKALINTHKNQSDEDLRLPEKTYNNIFNSISYWSDTAADRFIIAWHKNEDLNLTYGWNIVVNEKDIEEFVKARNKITHSGQREITEQIAYTGIALSALVYSLTLQRIGFSRESVRDIMERRLIR